MLKALYEQTRFVRNIGLAPNNRLTYIYPIKGNEKAVGLYYPDLPDQWPAVQHAIERRTPTLAGPLLLKQGGVGLIYRVPVFAGVNGEYWGLFSMVIDYQSLFSDVGIAPLNTNLNLALRGRDGMGSTGDIFMGDAALFSTDSVKVTIHLPGGTWQIAALPSNGWSTGREIRWVRMAGWTSGLIFGLLLTIVIVSIGRRLRAEKALRDSEQRWKFALEGAGHGVWDWNLQTGEMYLSKQKMNVLGYNGEDATHTHINEWIDRQHPEDRTQRKKALEDYFSGKVPFYTCEFRTKAQDGR